MNITLNQKEIETAITRFVTNQGINLDGKTMDVEMTAGRGPNGFSASIELMEIDDGGTGSAPVGNTESAPDYAGDNTTTGEEAPAPIFP